MPRPKKIVTAVVEETLLDFIDVEEYVVEPVSISVPELDTLEVEEFVSPVAVEKPVVQMTEPEPDPVAIYNVYEGETLVGTVKDQSPELMGYLEINHNQLLDGFEKLRQVTSNEEDLALFNIPFTDNRVYKSLKQYYLQNGLAPKPPRITSWMQYYLLKHPMMTEEEIVIEVFGPLRYSFTLA
jgi:hypothetical protein